MKGVNLKTVVGVGAGVALGHFVFKSKNPLALMAFGVCGGIIAHYAFKTREEKKAEVNKKSEQYIKEVEEDINATLNSADLDEGKSSEEGMAFNPRVGYITPKGTVDETDAQDYMDISFG